MNIISWAYVVMQTQTVAKHGEDFFEMREVYYDDDKPYGYSDGDATVCGESIEELRDTLRRMGAALDKPVMAEGDFDRGETTASDIKSVPSGPIWEELLAITQGKRK